MAAMPTASRYCSTRVADPPCRGRRPCVAAAPNSGRGSAMSSEAATGARMPPLHVYHDFLAPEDNAALLAWALAREADFAPSRLDGNVYNAERRSSVSLLK